MKRDSIFRVSPDYRLKSRLFKFVRHAVVQLTSNVNLRLRLFLIDRDVVSREPRAGSCSLKTLSGDNGRKTNLPSLVHQTEVALVR